MTASGDDPRLRLLVEIRDEIRGTNARLGSLDGRVEETNARLASLEDKVERIEGHTSALGERLDAYGRRQTESELRLSTEVLALADVTRQVRDLLATRLDDHDAVVDHERRLAALEERRG